MRKQLALLMVVVTMMALLPLGVAAQGPSRRSAEPSIQPPTLSNAQPMASEGLCANADVEMSPEAQPETKPEIDPRSFSLGLVPSEGDLPMLDTSHLERRLTALPDHVDMSSELPPIGNQGSQGSCVGWSSAYYYKTFQEARERGWSVASQDHQFSPAFVYNQRSTSNCGNDSGMSFYNGYSIIKNKGAATLSAFPYSSSDSCTQPTQVVSDAAYQYRCDSFSAVFSGQGNANIQVLKQLLADGHAFTVGVPIYTSFYGVTYGNPVVPQHQQGETFWGGHAMLVVGYDDTMGGFLTVNSWGSGWCRNGLCYLSYDFVQNDAWEAWVMYDHVAAPLPNAQVVLNNGWNLVSLPVVPSDTAVTNVFAPVMGQIEQINMWASNSQQWLRYSPHVPSFANTLTHVNPDQGLWVKTSSAATLNVTGSYHAQSVSLSAGWNLAAYTGGQAKSPDEALASIEERCTVVMGYQSGGTMGDWLSYYAGSPVEQNSLQLMEPGHGYWIHVSQACTWSPA